MLLAYVDESYSKDYFFLCALLVQDGHQATAIEQGLDALLLEFRDSGAAKVDPETELHGKELFHGQDDWAGVPVRSRIAIYRRALGVVAASGAEIYLRGLDCKRQRERYSNAWPPHEVVLDMLLESLHDRAASADDHVLVVADEVHTSERHRSNFRFAKKWGTFGNYKSSKLDRVIDTIHFAPSHHSRLLQGADLVAYLHHRRATVTEKDERATKANNDIWTQVEPVVKVNRLWCP